MLPIDRLVILLLMLTVAFDLSLAFYAFRYQRSTSARVFGWLVIAVAIYAFGYTFELSTSTLSAKLLWIWIQYVGIIAFAPLWLILALRHTGQKNWPRHPILFGLITISVITFFAALTIPYHNLFYINPAIDSSGWFPVVVFQPGPLYWLDVFANQACILVALGYYIVYWRRAAPLFRRQTEVLILASVIPWIGQTVYILGILPHQFDINPVVLTFTVMVFWAGHSKYRLTDVLPVARERVFETTTQGVLVLDDQDRIVDLNPAAIEMFPALSSRTVLGKKIALVLKDEPEFYTLIMKQEDKNVEYERTVGGERNFLRVKGNLLLNRNGKVDGQVLLIGDITKRKLNEEEREQLINDLQTALHDIKRLQGLLPICSHCKKIRDDKGYWNRLEEYFTDHSDVQFTHGICPDCRDKLLAEMGSIVVPPDPSKPDLDD